MLRVVAAGAGPVWLTAIRGFAARAIVPAPATSRPAMYGVGAPAPDGTTQLSGVGGGRRGFPAARQEAGDGEPHQEQPSHQGPGFAAAARAASLAKMATSTRRLVCRPASVSLEATGSVSPRPRAVMRAALTPWDIR